MGLDLQQLGMLQSAMLLGYPRRPGATFFYLALPCPGPDVHAAAPDFMGQHAGRCTMCCHCMHSYLQSRRYTMPAGRT